MKRWELRNNLEDRSLPKKQPLYNVFTVGPRIPETSGDPEKRQRSNTELKRNLEGKILVKDSARSAS